MKTYHLSILILLAYSCASDPVTKSQDEQPEHAQTETEESVTTLKDSSMLLADTLNYTDQNGLKQGKWIVRGYKNKVISVHNYLNDTLHGYWFEWKGMQSDGYYSHGRKNGFFRTYYGDLSDGSVLSITYVKNDTAIWSAHPAADGKWLVPVKGIHVKEDFVYVSIPHSNGNIWYEGLFVEHHPQGIHQVFKEDGTLRGRVDYEKGQVIIPDSSEYYPAKSNRLRFAVVVE